MLPYAFRQRALLAAVLVGLTAPTVGVHLVQRRLALIGDGLGHVALAGVAIGVLTGSAPVLTALACATVGAVAIEVIATAERPAAMSPSPSLLRRHRRRCRQVAARFLASMATAMVEGWIWLRIGREEFVARARRRQPTTGSRLEVFRATATHDVLHAGGFLVVGGLTAATLQVIVPRDVLDSVASAGPFAVLALAGLAVVLAICSEADAFVAASLSQFSLTARLAFLVVGPAVDVKLIALQAGTFGRAFAVRFAPLTFAVALVSPVIVGTVLL